LKLLDLFSGIGGFSLAAEWAGFETVAFCERDKFCQQVLKKHWPDVPIHDDIKTLKGFPVDMITAGFPCQPFSVAGKQKGINDDRYLWPDTMRLIRECQPTWCILENVPGIIPHLDPILEDLENEAYDWRAFLIPASSVGAPHKRERLWIVANRNSERCNERWHHWEARHLQDDWQQHLATLQSEWSQFQPESWQTFNTQDWLESATDTDGNQCNQRATHHEAESVRPEWPESAAEIGNASNALQLADTQTNTSSDAERSRGQTRSIDSRKYRSCSSTFNWQEDQPPVPGVDDGLPNGLDRNKALGNSIVPQIPYLFMMMIRRLYAVPSAPSKYSVGNA
jgi:DNA (cytosine-5)-methyltransferase 1